MRIHSNLATASELKGIGATKGQIQLAKSGWRSVELDPDSSKHQIKKARNEQGRIARLFCEPIYPFKKTKVQGRIVCLCWGIDEPTYPLVKLDTRIIHSTLIASLGLNESLYRFLDKKAAEWLN